MAHDHSHDTQSYYVEQLCTIAIAGALGGIAVMLYREDLLFFVADKVKPWVLGGGIALLVVVALRAVAVWLQAGRTPAEGSEKGNDHPHDHDQEPCHEHAHGAGCDHNHDHDHDHGHGHGHDHSHGHGEGDGHEHGWAPWRFVILLFPVVLYFLGLPNKNMAGDPRDAFKDVSADATAGNKRRSEVLEVNFPELQRASSTPDSRAYYTGKTLRIKGEYLPGNKRMFTLVRYRMNCCARDAVPLKAAIVLDKRCSVDLPEETLVKQWVLVEGEVQFEERPDGWLTKLILNPDNDYPLVESKENDRAHNDRALIKITEKDSNYYLQY
ncbi:MAG TPA: hypothetical protein VKA46_16765 [Gemmataceae bacterium]|nr:hypothetical protein [Gemmataceae bacterium]